MPSARMTSSHVACTGCASTAFASLYYRAPRELLLSPSYSTLAHQNIPSILSHFKDIAVALATMPSRTSPASARAAREAREARHRQAQVDAVSNRAVTGSYIESSSDSELDIELENPVDVTEQRQQRLSYGFLTDRAAPWTPMHLQSQQRRQSEASLAIRNFDRVFEQRDRSPPRRATR
ncbi:hypothetical protein N431DRAFT_554857 [Stipitochalara longipes BDJ]|nr:hypothetical protein N431DRAFT_554857 [Stipitochalara longipes BDJ]